MKRTLIPTALAIAVGGAMGFAALPASATPHEKNKDETSETGTESGSGDEGSDTEGSGDEGTDTEGSDEEGTETEGAEDTGTSTEAEADDEADAEDMVIYLSPSAGTAKQINENGVKTWGENVITGETTITWTDKDGNDVAAWFGQPDTDATVDSFESNYKPQIPEDYSGTITYTYSVATENGPAAVSLDMNVEPAADDADAAPAERELHIDPETISTADFVDEEKGVKITATGFDEGETVTLEVTAGPENVQGVTLTEIADENGVASFGVYGTNPSNPAAYRGDYEVEVTGADDAADDEDPLTGSFEVSDGEGGGEAGGSDSSQLPRTGGELGGLGLGLGLLVAGGAAVLLTKRRAKASNGPADV